MSRGAEPPREALSSRLTWKVNVFQDASFCVRVPRNNFVLLPNVSVFVSI